MDLPGQPLFVSVGPSLAPIQLPTMNQYWDTLASQLPQHGETIAKLRDLHHKKLWHHLTDEVQAFVHQNDVRAAIPLEAFYRTIIVDFGMRMNQLRHVEIAVSIGEQIQALDKRYEFLEFVASQKDVQDQKDAYCFIRSEMAYVQVQANLLKEASETIDKIEIDLEKQHSVDARSHAAFHRAQAAYYKAKCDPHAFYKAGLQFIAYAQLDELPNDERFELAIDMGKAAMISPELYHFGELLESGILNYLSNSKYDWIYLIVSALNDGNLALFHNLETHHTATLNANFAPGFEPLIRQKASMSAIIELAFEKSSDEKNISFDEIASVGHIAADKVEPTIMKALSLGLLKGKINEPERTASIVWVQPRFLSDAQVAAMKDRLAVWHETVYSTLNFVERQLSPEVLS